MRARACNTKPRPFTADTLSVVAFEAGMFAFMALVYFLFFRQPHLGTDRAAYWLMMQIAMAIGLATTYPVQVWLIRRGIKHAMGRPTSSGAGPSADLAHRAMPRADDRES